MLYFFKGIVTMRREAQFFITYGDENAVIPERFLKQAMICILWKLIGQYTGLMYRMFGGVPDETRFLQFCISEPVTQYHVTIYNVSINSIDPGTHKKADRSIQAINTRDIGDTAFKPPGIGAQLLVVAK